MVTTHTSRLNTTGLQHIHQDLTTGLQHIHQDLTTGLQHIHQHLTTGLQHIHQDLTTGLQHIHQDLTTGLQNNTPRLNDMVTTHTCPAGRAHSLYRTYLPKRNNFAINKFANSVEKSSFY